MKRSLLTMLVTLVVASRSSVGAPGGTISGKVILVEGGKVKVKDKDDIAAFVYLEQVSPRRTQAPPPPVREIRQTARKFVPHVIVVPVGTTVTFPNYDREEHNVFSPTEEEEFDLGRYNTNKKGKSHLFEGAGEMMIYCDIHREMWARVKVVDSDYIAEVKDGAFSFTGLPAGTYKVHAWFRDSEETKQLVKLGDGATVITRDLKVHVDPLRPHLRKDGTPYCPGQYCPP